MQVVERRYALGIGAAAIAIGVGILVAVHLDPNGATAPLFVVEAAAGTFIAAGVSYLALALGLTLLSRLAGLLVVYLLAVPGLWMLFADGSECSVGAAISGITLRGTASDWSCRAVFGGGGLLTLMIGIAMTWQVFRGKPPSGDRPPKGT